MLLLLAPGVLMGASADLVPTVAASLLTQGVGR
jgi:hypothetical protein